MAKTIFVAVALCLVASMIVSAAAVALRPIQEVNALKDKQINILQVAGIYEPGHRCVEAFAAFEPQVLELETGEFTDQFDPAPLMIAPPPMIRRPLVALDDDPAGIGRQGKYVTVYLLRDEAGEIDKVILPIHGYGLWSTLYGFIALEENGNDIFGLQFYEHAETPGLGAEVDNPRWKALWNGKRLADDERRIADQRAKTVSASGRGLSYRRAGRRDADLRRRRQPGAILDGRNGLCALPGKPESGEILMACKHAEKC